MIHQPFYIFSGIILSILTFYFYNHNFNLWVVGISGFFAIAQFPLIFEEKEKKNKVSLEKNLTFDKDIPRTIERSIALVIGALNIHLGLNKIKGKIVKISKVKNKKTEFRTDKENYLLSVSFLYCLIDQGTNFSRMDKDTYNKSLESLVKKFNKKITSNKNIKSFFSDVDLNPLEFLKTCQWLSLLKKEPAMEIVYATSFHMQYSLLSNKETVPDDKTSKDFIKKGSRIKAGDVTLFALSKILCDSKIKLNHNLA
jgi:hypothetical protein|tara:strand:+ start:353 stop:1117 length:765 start_codon:yes stop_codon:yes gene_type:complete